MTRRGKLATATMSLTLSGLAWLSSPMLAPAAPITDTFQFTGASKEWCQGNPKFFETFTVKVTDGVTLTLTQDPLNTGDVTALQATLQNTDSADLDAITLQGLAFPSNKAHSLAQLILFGTNPGNPDHFLAIRGQATFNKLGSLTKVTGTLWDQITGTYTIDKHGTQSGPVECFDTVTFVTGKKLP